MTEALKNPEDSEPLEDRDLMTELVRAMVELPEAVQVSEDWNDAKDEVTLWIDVAPKDRGKVIGKQGNSVNALRTLFAGIGALQSRRILVMVREPGKTFTRPPPFHSRRVSNEIDHTDEDLNA